MFLVAPCLPCPPRAVGPTARAACRYVARIDDKLTLKLGPRYDMGCHLPPKDDGWEMAANGCDFAIWERKCA